MEKDIEQIRADIKQVSAVTTQNMAKLAALEAAEKQKYDNLLKSLDSLQKDIKDMRHSISELEILATQGQSSLKTLLWVGGFIAALATLVLNFYSGTSK